MVYDCRLTDDLTGFVRKRRCPKCGKKWKTIELYLDMVTLTSQRDIYENNANMATRRLRSRILAILPSWFVEDCITDAFVTI